MKKGLLTANEIIKDESLLEKARPDKNERESLVSRVKADPNNKVFNGISVFFGEPDWEKITDSHVIKRNKLVPYRINLSRLLKDYPQSSVWGVELLPDTPEMETMPLKGQERHLKKLGYKWEGTLRDGVERELSIDDVRQYGKQDARSMWKYYDPDKHKNYYAANVPHALIIPPKGRIDPAYISRC